MPGRRQGAPHMRDNHTADRLFITKPDLSFRRVHVHVDALRWNVQKQRHHRMAVSRHQVLVRAANGTGEQTISDRPPIDEKVLR